MCRPLIFLLAITFVGCSTGHSSKGVDIRAANMHAKAGAAYSDSLKAVKMSPYLACQWPEEYPGSDEPGAAYKEGQAAAEDADCHEDESTS